MAQHSTYITSNSTLRSGIKQEEQHITQTRVQNVDMLPYNSSNSNNESKISAAAAEPGGNAFAISSSNVIDQTVSVLNQNTNAGAIMKERLVKHSKQQQARKPPPTIETFWPIILQDVQNAVIDSKHQSLPLARIKKIMKLDENAKMIAAEAPTLFAKACEFFIQELTMRAWIHTDESKRRTLQRSDIAQAIANYDQFDFLIDIVPREDIKPPSHRRHHNENTSSTSHNSSPAATNASANGNSTMTTTVSNMMTGEIFNVANLPAESVSSTAVPNTQPATTTISGSVNQTQPTQMVTTTGTNHNAPQLQIIHQTASPQQHLQYFITLPGQQPSGQAQLVHQLQLQQQHQQHLNNTITSNPPIAAASLNLVAQQPQQLILTAANPTGAQSVNMVQHQAALLQNIAQNQQQHAQHPQQVQLLQHVMLTPNGEITNMPVAINANQLNLLRLQMQQQQQQQQQIIIPTHLLTAQQLLQLQSHTQNPNQVTPGTTAHIVHHQPHQQPPTQHHSQTPTTTNNIFIHTNTAVSNQANPATAASMVSTDRNMGSTFRNNC